MKAYTDLEQSKKLAEILPLESADMVLPFTCKENNEYVPGYAVLRNYIEVYNDILSLPAMDIDTVCKLIQPCWSLAALLDILPNGTDIIKGEADTENERYMCTVGTKKGIISTFGNNPVAACFEMVIKLHK